MATPDEPAVVLIVRRASWADTWVNVVIFGVITFLVGLGLTVFVDPSMSYESRSTLVSVWLFIFCFCAGAHVSMKFLNDD